VTVEEATVEEVNVEEVTVAAIVAVIILTSAASLDLSLALLEETSPDQNLDPLVDLSPPRLSLPHQRANDHHLQRENDPLPQKLQGAGLHRLKAHHLQDVALAHLKLCVNILTDYSVQ